ncbi:MAG: OsmC family protein [Actinobacteria bacterium]|nr:OsmC family protein [Actinomycetota bacterium]
MGHVHHYRAHLEWSGSTGVGYDAYPRGHLVTFDGVATVLEVSADPAFRGEPTLANPEQLLLAAASSCQLLSFLAVAARARIDVVDYRDDATAVMPEDDPPMRITRVELRPTITLRLGRGDGDGGGGDGPRPSRARLDHLVDVAHRECFIANSLTGEIVIDPTFVWVG